uniref:Uncharacterized protein n=1 Tax=Arundo donax TaxID=35708 RepID=A0A0A9EQ20_ARUDO
MDQFTAVTTGNLHKNYKLFSFQQACNNAAVSGVHHSRVHTTK